MFACSKKCLLCLCGTVYVCSRPGGKRMGEVYGRQGGVYTACLCHTHYVYCAMFIETLLERSV